MANSITIQIRGDTAANWTSKNPVPKDRELCYDKTNNQLKTGDGATAWNSLKYTPEIVNGLTSTSANAALSAAQGKALADRITTLENKPAGSNVTVTDNLTSTSTTAALSANQGRVLNGKIPTISTSTSSTSTSTVASSSAVKSAYDRASTAISNASTAQSRADSAYSRADSAYSLASSANSKIPSGTILTSSNYSSYISSGISQGVTSVNGYYLWDSGSFTVPSGGTWLVIIFFDLLRTRNVWEWPSSAIGLVAGGTTLTTSNLGSYLKGSNGNTNQWYSSSNVSSAVSKYALMNCMLMRVK